MERDLVRIVGRSEELGRPFLDGITRLFCQLFGLRHLDELPQPEFLDGNLSGPVGPEMMPMDIPRSDKEAVNHLTGDFSQGEEGNREDSNEARFNAAPGRATDRTHPGGCAGSLGDGGAALEAYKDDDDVEEVDDDDDLDEDEKTTTSTRKKNSRTTKTTTKKTRISTRTTSTTRMGRSRGRR